MVRVESGLRFEADVAMRARTPGSSADRVAARTEFALPRVGRPKPELRPPDLEPYQCWTTTLEPTRTRWYRSMTSSLVMRMQPEDTA